MSKFKLNSEWETSPKNRKKHSTKKNRDEGDFHDFAYMSRSGAKNELRHLKDMYGI